MESNSGTWKCFKVTFPIFIIRSDIRYWTEISVISSQYLISICNLSFQLKVTIIFFKNIITSKIKFLGFFFYFLIIVWTVKAKVTGCSWHEGTIADKEIISYWSRWHWHTGSYLLMCTLTCQHAHTNNVSKPLHMVTLTPLAAAICTMTWVAVWLKKRPSPPTTMVEPWRSRRSMEEKTLWMKLWR